MSSLNHHLALVEAAGLTSLTESQPDLIYGFRHALIQEAAYHSLTRHQRVNLHGLVGESLETIHAARLSEWSSVLAYHFTAAKHTEKAAAYARDAARQAVARNAYDEAQNALRAALSLFAVADPSAEHGHLTEDLADVLRLMHRGREALSLYEAARALGSAAAAGDPVTAIRLDRKIVQTVAEIRWSVTVKEYTVAATAVEAALAHLQAGLASAEHLVPHPETVLLLVALARHAWNVQSPPDWEASARYARTAIGLAERLPQRDVLAVALGALAAAEFGGGRLRGYRDVALRRVEVCRAEDFDHPRERLEALRDAGSALMYVGAYQRALAFLQEAEQLARSVGAQDQIFNALVLQSQCWFRLDRWDDVLRIQAEWTGLVERFGRERLGIPCFAMALDAAVRARRGDLAAAQARRQEAYEAMVALTGETHTWYRNQHY